MSIPTPPFHDAILLAAGLGTRMGEKGKKLPKPLFTLGGKPLLDHILENLEAVGINRVAVNIHHRARELETHLRQRSHPEILLSDERNQLLDTGGGILQALHLLHPATACFVHNCDAFWLANESSALCSDFARMARLWNPEQMDALLLLQPVEEEERPDFSMGKNGTLHPVKGENGFRYVGLQIVSLSLFGGESPGSAFPVPPLWKKSMEQGRLYGMEADTSHGRWLHVGSLEALAQAERLLPPHWESG